MSKKSKRTIRQLQERNQALFAEVEILHTKLNSAAQERGAVARELETARGEVHHLRPRVENLEGLNERLTLMLSNEQALRMKALPPPKVGWFARLMGRRPQVVSVSQG
jgi:predicted nuclease with TOPRIM domain